MTNKCWKLANQFKNDERYEGLSIEATLLVLIDDVGIDDVRYLLDNNNWENELKEFRNDG